MNPDASAGRSQIKDVLERSISDEQFRRQLLADPDSALTGYELSEVQIMLLRDFTSLPPYVLE